MEKLRHFSDPEPLEKRIPGVVGCVQFPLRAGESVEREQSHHFLRGAGIDGPVWREPASSRGNLHNRLIFPFDHLISTPASFVSSASQAATLGGYEQPVSGESMRFQPSIDDRF